MDGQLLNPDSITQLFSGFVRRSEFSSISIHVLRHTNATLMIAGGTNIRTVSARLGHTQTSTMANIYSHAIQSADAAAELIEDFLTPPHGKTGLSDMYNAPDLKTTLERKERLLEWMQEQAPKAEEILDEGFDDVTGVFGLPAAYRKRLRTTNSIERLNEELRRRERVIRIFPNEASLIRLMGSVLMDIHEKWMTGKKYFTMDKYYEERDAAKQKAKEDRPKHLHIVS